jgi:hypothetical protein
MKNDSNIYFCPYLYINPIISFIIIHFNEFHFIINSIH